MTMATDTATAREFETVIGLEIHAQMITRSKMFSTATAAIVGALPNSCIDPVCTGLPGVLPVINRAAVRQATRVALALHSNIQLESRFDRKNYTYPDLPKGYQITQYDLPLSLGGHVTIATEAGERRIGITRVHMEEDTGRNVHRTHADGSSYTLVDLNRAGIPLLEIVGEPDLRSPDEARKYFETLRNLLRYIGACSGNMEEGALRCDANISLRPWGREQFGAKVEIKNVNSFRALYRALVYETERQAMTLRSGGVVEQETRGWSEPQGVTLGQRSKEQAHDYRYFPEPDLPPLVLTSTFVDECRVSLPELPEERRNRYVAAYSLNSADALALTESPVVADYFEAIIGGDTRPERGRAAAARITNDVFTLDPDRDAAVAAAPAPEAIRELLDLVEAGTISATAAKTVFTAMIETGERARAVIGRLGLAQVSDEDTLLPAVDAAIAANPKAVADYRSGKSAAVNALVGAVIKTNKGANFGVVRSLLIRRLEETQ